MWKDSFIARLRVFLAIFMLLALVDGGLVLSTVNGSNDLMQIKSDIQNIEYIFIFLFFLLAVMLFFYIPLMMSRKLKEIHHLLREITEGNYYPDIDMKRFDQDREFLEFVKSIQKMLQVVVKFDQLKAEKITEHNNRINGMLSLACNGFIIVAETGDITYINDLVKENFPEFEQNNHFYDDIFSPFIEQSIKPYVIKMLRSGSKGEDLTLKCEPLGKDISVKSVMVRDEEGEPIGAIIALYGLPRKEKLSKPQEK